MLLKSTSHFLRPSFLFPKIWFTPETDPICREGLSQSAIHSVNEFKQTMVPCVSGIRTFQLGYGGLVSFQVMAKRSQKVVNVNTKVIILIPRYSLNFLYTLYQQVLKSD